MFTYVRSQRNTTCTLAVEKKEVDKLQQYACTACRHCRDFEREPFAPLLLRWASILNSGTKTDTGEYLSGMQYYYSVFPMCRCYTQFSDSLRIEPLHKCVLSCHESVMASWVECTLHCWALIARCMSYFWSNETRNSRCLGRKLAETESVCNLLIFKGKDTIVFIWYYLYI